MEFTSRLIDALAWPGVVLVAVLAFRKRIGDWLSKLLDKPSGKFAAGPLAASWNADTAVALGDAGQHLAEPDDSVELADTAQATDELRVEVTLSAEGQVSGEHQGGGSQRAESESRRRNVEALIEAAARWGWDQCNAKLFSGFPTPIVDWDNNDRPYILAGKVMNPGDIVSVRRTEGTWRTRSMPEPDRDLLAPPNESN